MTRPRAASAVILGAALIVVMIGGLVMAPQ